MSIRTLVGAGLVVAALLGAGAAEAKTWSFSYSGDGESGSGRFITGDVGSPYTVTGITGTVTESSGLSGASAITGMSLYASADQALYATGASYFSYAGVSFSTLAGVDFNFTSYPNGANSITNSLVNPTGGECCTTSIAMTVTPVPEASTWAMLLAGFAGLGLAGLRGRKARGRVSI